MRRTGGLADTVRGYDGHNAQQANGFTFDDATPGALRDTVRWALISEIDQAEVLAPIHRLRTFALTIFGLTTAGVLVVSAAIARRLTREARDRLFLQAEAVVHERRLDALDPHAVILGKCLRLRVTHAGMVAALGTPLSDRRHRTGHRVVGIGRHHPGKPDRECDADGAPCDDKGVVAHRADHLVGPAFDIGGGAALDQKNDTRTGEAAPEAGQAQARWEELKAAEKQRRSVTDGVPDSMPASLLAVKLLGRAGRKPETAVVPAVADADARAHAAAVVATALGATDPATAVGSVLLGIIAAASAAGVDTETALRAAVRDYRARLQASEVNAQ